MMAYSNVERITIKNSPIEFLIVAPHGGRDKVVVSTENAGLDLLGVAVDRLSPPFSYSTSSSILFSGSKSRSFNIVESNPVEDFDTDADHRISTMRFVWVGECSSERREDIEKAFKRSGPDVRLAILCSNFADLEWSISSVILQCSLAQERRHRSRRIFYLTMAMYAIAAGFAAAYAISRSLIMR